MSAYRLLENLYVLPTPAGAYYVASQQESGPMRTLLSSLMREESSPQLTEKNLLAWVGTDNPDDALETFYLAQEQGWVEGFSEARSSRPGALEEILPELLPPLSASGKAMLADAHGFYVAAAGFPHEAAVELAALSADLASLDARHHALTRQNLRIGTSAWALVDAAGNSQVGFWPLFIDSQRFVLILQGVPQLNQPAFTSLVWALNIRYAEKTN